MVRGPRHRQRAVVLAATVVLLAIPGVATASIYATDHNDHFHVSIRA
ncbi:MAG TPA: hypothetical protein VFR67_12100 [Pilimelia sp.]|nr:hypothetical protein [Pilimelia sp.]